MDEQTARNRQKETQKTRQILKRIAKGGAEVYMAGTRGAVKGVHRCRLGWLQKDAKKYIRGCGDERESLHEVLVENPT